jgi:hypothetical protein
MDGGGIRASARASESRPGPGREEADRWMKMGMGWDVKDG